jgi:predicted RNase H-like nuclease
MPFEFAVFSAKLAAIGADGARGGWATALLFADSLDADDRASWQTRLGLASDINELIALREHHAPGAAVAIDVPIGLPATTSFRACDLQARELLKERRNSVFTPPARHLLAAGGDYQAALTLVAEEQKTNPAAKSLSAQAAGLIPKIAQVDEWVRAHADSEAWLWECHPELSFLALNNGNSLVGDKRSAAGLTHRLQLLRAEFPDIEDQLVNFEHGGEQAELSDVLDAYAALSTAVECARGDQEELGDGTRDDAGILMRMAR